MAKKEHSGPFNLLDSLSMLKAIAHPVRLQILSFIHSHGEVPVNKIYSALDLEQSITSQHLKIMRQAGILLNRKSERFVFYVIDYDMMNKTFADFQNYLTNKA